MKKRLLLVIMAAAMLLTMLAGCNKADSSLGIKTPEDGLKTEQPANNPNGDTPEKEEIKPLEDDSDSKLNANLISDIGLTYNQLLEKHGKLIKAGKNEGRYFYVFENGYGNYVWSSDNINLEGNPLLCDENGNFLIENAPLPKKDSEFYEILNIDPENLFIEMPLPEGVSDIEKKYDIEKIGIINTYNKMGRDYVMFSCEKDFTIGISASEIIENYGRGVFWNENDLIENVISTVPKKYDNVKEIIFSENDKQITEGNIKSGMDVKIIYDEKHFSSMKINSIKDIYSYLLHKDQIKIDGNAKVSIQKYKEE